MPGTFELPVGLFIALFGIFEVSSAWLGFGAGHLRCRPFWFFEGVRSVALSLAVPPFHLYRGGRVDLIIGRIHLFSLRAGASDSGSSSRSSSSSSPWDGSGSTGASSSEVEEVEVESSYLSAIDEGENEGLPLGS